VDELGNKRGIDALASQRDSIQQQIEMAQKIGDFPGVQTLQGQLEGVNEQLRQMADDALKAYGNLSGPEAEAARAALMKIKSGATDSKTEFIATGKSINESFASGATNAFTNFAKNVAAGKNVFKSLGDAFRQFAADFMIQIAQMILKQMIFNAISGGGAGGGGLGGAITSIFHSGGIVGGGAASKSVNPGVFAGALRYHTGGIAGLAADEVPAVLRQGEEVLTSSDPRHRNNGGAGAGGSPNIKIVNAVDGSDALNHALSQKAGEQTLLNFMRDNSQAIRAALG
jgi:phage-related minor tail protein